MLLLKDRRFKSVLNHFNTLESTIFKFVVSSEQDICEIIKDYQNFCALDHHKIYLMPAADSRDTLQSIEPTIIELCKKYRFKYSTRLHIHTWNKKTGT